MGGAVARFGGVWCLFGRCSVGRCLVLSWEVLGAVLDMLDAQSGCAWFSAGRYLCLVRRCLVLV